MIEIDRAFVRIAEGLVHYRHAGGHTGAQDHRGKPLPLYMIHASPMNGITMEPLMSVLGETRRVIAPDTLGYGDSAPPAQATPEIADYAESVARVLNALKLDKIDLYGSHTGAHIAVEVALRYPMRVRKLVIDGIGMFSAEDKADFLTHYAPEMTRDDYGSQFTRAFNWTRDGMLFFPHFRRTAENARYVTMPSAEALHTMTVEMLKSLRHYHKGYRAAFRHPDRERMALLDLPTYCMASEDDILADRVAIAAPLIKGCKSGLLPSEGSPEGLRTKAAAIAAFLDA